MSEDVQLRLLVFVGVLVFMSSLEALLPKRERSQMRVKRWATNLLLVVANSFFLRLLGPVTAVVAANFAMDNGWGLLSWSPVALPLWLEIVIGVALLDLAIYAQHVASHQLPWLWRFHKIHHADRDIDTTTGIRFHPIEAILSMLYKCVVILLIGPIALAVIVFEITLNASAMFNHANLRLPRKLDQILRLVIVTPDSHRVHHSDIVSETNSNYGFFLSIWDRLFNTYQAQPAHGHQDMTIGLSEYQNDQPSSLLWCLREPFKTNPAIKPKSN